MTRDEIYECIPEATREAYGSNRDEQIDNFMKENPDIFEDVPEQNLKTEQDILDYIVVTLTENISITDMAFKGGYILNKRIPNCRMTHDIDFSIERVELYEKVKGVLANVGDKLKSMNLIVDYEIKPEVTPTTSGGIKFIYADGSKALGVDVGLHTLGFGITSMSIQNTDINVFTVERSIGDKLSVLCSRRRFRRIKDIYDIYMLSEYYSMGYNAVEEALSYREVDWNLYPKDEEQLVQLGHAYDRLLIRGVTSRPIAKPDYNKVLERLLVFCDPWLSGYLPKNWNHKRGCWE